MSARTSQTRIEGKTIIVPNAKFLREQTKQVYKKVREKIVETLSPKEIVNSLGITLFQIKCSGCKKTLNFKKSSNFAKHQKKFHPEKFKLISEEFEKSVSVDLPKKPPIKKKHSKNVNRLILEKTKQTGKIHWIEGVNGAGKKMFKGVCPECHVFFAFAENKSGMYRHLWLKHQIGDPPKETTPLVSEAYLYRNQEEINNFKAERIFYVDAAQSIRSKEGKIYWKTSLVENNREILGWANSKTNWANEAEAYAILKTILYLVENKIDNRVLIYSDSTICVSYMGGWGKKKIIEDTFNRYISFARKLIQENNLKVMVSWVRGKENPADYYSRLPYKNHKSSGYTSRKIEVPLKHYGNAKL